MIHAFTGLELATLALSCIAGGACLMGVAILWVSTVREATLRMRDRQDAALRRVGTLVRESQDAELARTRQRGDAA